MNAFASYGDPGENIFIFSRIILYVKTPNELIGVMAHETGHIKAGHLIRGEVWHGKSHDPHAAVDAGGRGGGDRGRGRPAWC